MVYGAVKAVLSSTQALAAPQPVCRIDLPSQYVRRDELADLETLFRGALALGLVIIVVLVVRGSAQSIAVLLSRAGWRLLLLVPLHTVPLLLDVMGWRVLIFDRTRTRSLFLIAAIREAINRLLPVANVGGEFVGIRLLSVEGIGAATATSSVIVEMLLNLAAQYLFFELGLALLLRITGSVQGTGTLLIVFVGPLHRFSHSALALAQRRAIQDA